MQKKKNKAKDNEMYKLLIEKYREQFDVAEEDIDEEVSDDAVPYQSSTTKDLPEEYNESEELELEEIDDK